MNSSDDFEELYRLFERCNHTELYQMARRRRLPVLPDLAKEALIKVLIGQEEPPPLPRHEIDEYRRAIMRFLIDHQKRLATQLTCPARSFREDACFGCIDVQVTACLTGSGKENQKLIQLRKK